MSSRLATASPIPLYYQVANVLQARIHSGARPAGSLLGTDASLAEEFGVSRITIRQAVAALVEKGLVERHRARGTFVTDGGPVEQTFEFHGFLEDLILQGEGAAQARVTRNRTRADADVAEALDVAVGDSVVRFRRVRVRDGAPVAVVVNWLPPDIGDDIEPADLRTTSLLRLLDARPGCRLASGVQTVEPAAADAGLARSLHLAPGDPVLRVRRIVRADGGRPIELAHAWYPPGRPAFTVRLGRVNR